MFDPVDLLAQQKRRRRIIRLLELFAVLSLLFVTAVTFWQWPGPK